MEKKYILYIAEKNSRIMYPARYIRFVVHKRYLFNAVAKLPHLLYASYKKKEKKKYKYTRYKFS